MKRHPGRENGGLRLGARANEGHRSQRRAFLGGVAALPLLALELLHAAHAQQPGRSPRIGIINAAHQDAFRKGLLEHGWVDGKNIRLEFRVADASAERRAAIAREFTELQIDCIVASGNVSVGAFRQAMPGTPLVMAFAADVVGSGFVANLRRPGGNVTGLTNINEELTGKRIELLKELNPRISRVAILRDPSITAHEAMWQHAISSAPPLGMKVFAINYRGVQDFDSAFAAIAKEKGDGLVVPQSPVATSARARVIALVAKARLPAIYQNAVWVDDGGLMSYGADEADLWRRSAGYVDRILKGAKPGDLPVEQPTKFDLTINHKTASAAGITVPSSLLLRADRVIR